MLIQSFIILLISIIIFYVINQIGGLSIKFGYTTMTINHRSEENFMFDVIFKIFAPVLSALVIAIILHALKLEHLYHNIWIAVVGAWLIRVGYIILFRRNSLISWMTLLFQIIASSMAAYWLYSILIKQPNLLIPSRDNMVSQIWLIVILFLYQTFSGVKPRENGSIKRKNEYQIKTFKKLKSKYGELIKENAKEIQVEILVYAIMIVENYNRPKPIRIFENFLGKFKKQGTYGIMQVSSEKTLNDRDSIIIGIERIAGLYEKTKTITEEKNPEYKNSCDLTYSIISRVAWFYNNSDSYSNEVYSIYDKLMKYQYPKLKPVDPDARFNALYHGNSGFMV